MGRDGAEEPLADEEDEGRGPVHDARFDELPPCPVADMAVIARAGLAADRNDDTVLADDGAADAPHRAVPDAIPQRPATRRGHFGPPDTRGLPQLQLPYPPVTTSWGAKKP